MKTDFFRRLVQGGGLSLVKLVTGLVKIKVLAALLGVDGLGLLSLALQFQATAVGLVSMSLAVGVINIGRPLWVRDDTDAAGAVLGTALSIVAINALLFLAAFALFRHAFGGAVISSFEAHGTGLLWLIALAAVVVSFANVLWEGLSFLVDRFDVYVRTNMIASFFDAILFSGGAWLFGLKGALVASLLSSLWLFAIYTVFSARAPAARLILARVSVARYWVGPLFSYSVLMLTTTAAGLVCMFFARAHLTATSGEAANGYLQVVTALAAYLLPFVMTGVWGHLHPTAAASGDLEIARLELRRTLVASMRLASAGCVAVMVGAPMLVQLVYTSAFLAARQYIPAYFAGELCFIFVSVMGVYLLAVGKKWAYFIGYTLYHAALLGGVVWLAESAGPWAYVIAHMAGAALVAVLAIAYGLRCGMLDASTLKAVSICAGAAAVCCWLDYLQITVDLTTLSIRGSWLLGSVVILFLLRPFLQKFWYRGWQ